MLHSARSACTTRSLLGAGLEDRPLCLLTLVFIVDEVCGFNNGIDRRSRVNIFREHDQAVVARRRVNGEADAIEVRNMDTLETDTLSERIELRLQLFLGVGLGN